MDKEVQIDHRNRNYLLDPSLYALLAMNLYMIYEYRIYPDSIHSIIALYWVQSVLIGLFNFLDILTLQKTVKDSNVVINGKKDLGKGCAAFFFLFHYGFFHVGYLIFLATIINFKKLEWKFMVTAFWIIAASQLLTFIQHKIRNSHVPANIGTMFFLPYLRIIPMHLMILIPAFTHISGYMIFLILKTIFDLVMQVVSHRVMYKQVVE